MAQTHNVRTQISKLKKINRDNVKELKDRKIAIKGIIKIIENHSVLHPDEEFMEILVNCGILGATPAEKSIDTLARIVNDEIEVLE